MLLLKIFTGLLILNYAILAAAWFPMKDGYGYNHYNQDTNEKISTENYDDGELKNATALSFYLFGTLWTLYFVICAVIAFLYDAYRPTKEHRAYYWGWTADIVTLIMICISIVIINQGTQKYGEKVTIKYMRPNDADSFTDINVVNRL